MGKDKLYLNEGKEIAGLAGVAGALALVMLGCSPPNIHDTSLDQQYPKQPAQAKQQTMAAVAGMPVKPGVATPPPLAVHVRPDPFALTPTEQAYDKAQEAAYISGMGPSFGFYAQPPAPPPPPPEVEPQPYRRLAGILIGDSVSALIDMGNGQLIDIHPGETIPGTDWFVQSIDQDKAVLHRINSNRLPTEVVVRLEAGQSQPEQTQTPGVGPGGNGAPGMRIGPGGNRPPGIGFGPGGGMRPPPGSRG